MIMGLATLVGFDAAANLAEEAEDPSSERATRRRRIGGGGRQCWGWAFLITLTLVPSRSIPRVTSSDSPVATVVRDQLGSGTERIFLVAITLAFFGAGIAVMTACRGSSSRWHATDVFLATRARCGGSIPVRHTPIPATVLDLRRRSGTHRSRCQGFALTQADHRVDDPPDDHLRRDDRPLPGRAQATRSRWRAIGSSNCPSPSQRWYGWRASCSS